jgi:antagonist of KipI
VTLEVLDPGLLTTVEDDGRPNFVHLGVPHGGAQDRWSLAVANALIDNPPDAAALEITLVGPRLRAASATTIGLAGADLGARVGSRRVLPGEVLSLVPGDELLFDGAASVRSGARAYLALAGGIDVPRVLGSRSTCLVAGFGGLEGRPLRAGDRITGTGHAGGAVPSVSAAGARWPGEAHPLPRADASGATVVRLLERMRPDGGARSGPPGERAARAPVTPAAVAWLVGRVWRIGSASDRMGLRLERGRTDRPEHGEHGDDASGGAGDPVLPEVLSHGITWGAVQLPPGGDPIVLLADHQPTGGYPAIGVVITADHPVLAQLAPGARLRFEAVSIPDAQRALHNQRLGWTETLKRYRADRGWDDLWLSAGG